MGEWFFKSGKWPPPRGVFKRSMNWTLGPVWLYIFKWPPLKIRGFSMAPKALRQKMGIFDTGEPLPPQTVFEMASVKIRGFSMAPKAPRQKLSIFETGELLAPPVPFAENGPPPAIGPSGPFGRTFLNSPP